MLRAPLATSIVLVSVALLACAAPRDIEGDRDTWSPDANASDAGPTPVPCAGRGSTLGEPLVVQSDELELELVHAEPVPPVAGDNLWVVEITRAEEAISGSLSVSAVMPDHEHGTPVNVEVVEEAPGRYQLSPINLFMPGYWVVQIQTLQGEQSTTFVLEVCVE